MGLGLLSAEKDSAKSGLRRSRAGLCCRLHWAFEQSVMVARYFVNTTKAALVIGMGT